MEVGLPFFDIDVEIFITMNIQAVFMPLIVKHRNDVVGTVIEVHDQGGAVQGIGKVCRTDGLIAGNDQPGMIQGIIIFIQLYRNRFVHKGNGESPDAEDHCRNKTERIKASRRECQPGRSP